MKIAFTGTHCTGKTSLVEKLKSLRDDLLEGYTFHSSFTRGLKERNLPINQSESDNYDLTQLLCLNKHLDSLTDQHSVSDRALIDALAYTLYLFRREQVSIWVNDYGQQLVSEYHKEYDLIFFCSSKNIPLHEDGVRTPDDSFREGVEQELLSLLNTHQGNLFEGPRVVKLEGSLESNFKKVVHEIKRLKEYGRS